MINDDKYGAYQTIYVTTPLIKNHLQKRSSIIQSSSLISAID